MADPLDALRLPDGPVQPSPAFAERLRRRLEEVLVAVPAPSGAVEEQEAEVEEQEAEVKEQEAGGTTTDLVQRGRLARNGTRHGDVSYLSMRVPDVAAARRFYGRVLGWTFGAAQPDGAAATDEVIPEVGLSPAAPGASAPGVLPSWRVDDVGAAVEAVRAAGGTAEDPVRRPYGLEAACTDGAGLRFWLHELPPSGMPAGPNGEAAGDVSYVVLRVADLRRAERLFGDVLGWSYGPGTEGVQVEGPVPMTGMSEGPPGVVLCYRVDDLRAVLQRVAVAGGDPGAVEPRPYGLEARCTDDQGVAFFLHQL